MKTIKETQQQITFYSKKLQELKEKNEDTNKNIKTLFGKYGFKNIKNNDELHNILKEYRKHEDKNDKRIKEYTLILKTYKNNLQFIIMSVFNENIIDIIYDYKNKKIGKKTIDCINERLKGIHKGLSAYIENDYKKELNIYFYDQSILWTSVDIMTFNFNNNLLDIENMHEEKNFHKYIEEPENMNELKKLENDYILKLKELEELAKTFNNLKPEHLQHLSTINYHSQF